MAMARTRLQWLGLRAPGRLLSPGSEALARSADLGNVQSLGSEFRHQGAKRDWDNAGATWIAAPGRHAQIYVFAHHPVTDDSADHRDAGQWRFYVVATGALPPAKTIGLGKLRRLGEEVGWGDLRAAVERLRLAAAPNRGGV
jgi:hypothetical protein